jgi:Helix-turn-helix domain
MSKPTLNDDATALVTIRRFIASLNKYPDLTPQDILLVAYLMTLKAEDHPVFPSHLTIARALHMNDKTVARSFARLQKTGYVTIQHRRGFSNSYALDFSVIPGEESLSAKVTPNAERLAVLYQLLVKKKGRKKFPKLWLGQQNLSAQRIINECGGDGQTAIKIVEFALASKRFEKRSAKSLYNLFRVWRSIVKAYHAQRGNSPATPVVAPPASPAQSAPTPPVTPPAEPPPPQPNEAQLTEQAERVLLPFHRELHIELAGKRRPWVEGMKDILRRGHSEDSIRHAIGYGLAKHGDSFHHYQSHGYVQWFENTQRQMSKETGTTTEEVAA